MEITHRYGGSIPFAHMSLTDATTLFLAICQGLMPGVTSVLPTSISDLSTTTTAFAEIESPIMCLRGKWATSSFSFFILCFIRSLDEKSLMISFSFNLLIYGLNLFAYVVK